MVNIMNIIDLLLRNGADVNAVDIIGNTALHLTVVQNDLDTVRLLLNRGINPFIMNTNGDMAIDLANAETDPDLIQLLVDRMREIALRSLGRNPDYSQLPEHILRYLITYLV
jgi:ankyrin repeat protein